MDTFDGYKLQFESLNNNRLANKWIKQQKVRTIKNLWWSTHQRFLFFQAETEGLLAWSLMPPIVTMQKPILCNGIAFLIRIHLWKHSFQRSWKLKKAPKGAFCYLSAGRKGLISKAFKHDLEQILTFW